MKKTFRIMLAAAVSVAMLGFTACKEKEENQTHDEKTESATYAIHYDGSAVAAGSTIIYQPTLTESNADFASVDLLLENKTNANQQTCLKIERTEGPDQMNHIMICYGETCKDGDCPWSSDAFTLVPGINNDMLVKFEYSPSQVTSKTTYRLTVGKGATFTDPQVVYINVN
jgi:hypothetical protein